MRDAVEPPRNSVLAGTHLVVSSHPLVSAAGDRVLADGGNAVDATLAMAAMSWLALPGQCGVGGDAFAIVREPDGTIWTLGGSGYGPDGGFPDFYREHEWNALPLDGPLAVAVPGAMACDVLATCTRRDARAGRTVGAGDRGCRRGVALHGEDSRRHPRLRGGAAP